MYDYYEIDFCIECFSAVDSVQGMGSLSVTYSLSVSLRSFHPGLNGPVSSTHEQHREIYRSSKSREWECINKHRMCFTGLVFWSCSVLGWSSLKYSEVWSRPGSVTAWWTSLAWRSRLCIFQACIDSLSVSERPCTIIPDGTLHLGLRWWHWAASAFSKSSSTCIAAFLAQHDWQAFSVVGPRVRNSLPDFIRGPTVSTDCLSRVFRTYVFAQY